MTVPPITVAAFEKKVLDLLAGIQEKKEITRPWVEATLGMPLQSTAEYGPHHPFHVLRGELIDSFAYQILLEDAPEEVMLGIDLLTPMKTAHSVSPDCPLDYARLRVPLLNQNAIEHDMHSTMAKPHYWSLDAEPVSYSFYYRLSDAQSGPQKTCVYMIHISAMRKMP